MSWNDLSQFDAAFAAVTAGLDAGAYPGAVAAVGDSGGIRRAEVFGWAALEPQSRPLDRETVFDLASLTKVVAGTPALLTLVEAGRVGLDQPVAELLPMFRHPTVTVRHLLTHSGGLAPWQGLYLSHPGWEAYTRAICALDLVRPPGTAVAYSDLSFILVGAIIQAVTGESLPEYCRRTIFAPLGMDRTGWISADGSEPAAAGQPASLPPERFAATERGNAVEFGMNGERAAGFDRWRTRVLVGETNDGNTYYGLNGISSHAGLFAPVDDLALYAVAWLAGGGPVLSPATVAEATRCQTEGLGERRGLGWQTAPAASSGDGFSERAFGHTGFTGTSLWIDPERDLFAILLTNRLHPVAREGVMDVRRRFHEAAAAAVAPGGSARA